MKIQESSGPETFSKGKHIYKNIHQRSYLKLWKTLHGCNNTYVELHSGAASNTVRQYFKIDKDIIILQDSTKTFWL